MHTPALCLLGAMGGGEINGKFYSEAECYEIGRPVCEQRLEGNPDDKDSWHGLCHAKGGSVGGVQYSTDECLAKYWALPNY